MKKLKIFFGWLLGEPKKEGVIKFHEYKKAFLKMPDGRVINTSYYAADYKKRYALRVSTGSTFGGLGVEVNTTCLENVEGEGITQDEFNEAFKNAQEKLKNLILG